MASYRIIFKPSVEKDLRTVPKQVAARVFQRIKDLADDPLPRQSLKLAGAEHLYRIRVGDYRIIYSVDQPAKQVIVQYVRHRRDAYRDM